MRMRMRRMGDGGWGIEAEMVDDKGVCCFSRLGGVGMRGLSGVWRVVMLGRLGKKLRVCIGI